MKQSRANPHTRIDEATPAEKYAGQFFEHARVHGSLANSTLGRMNYIRGNSIAEDLLNIIRDAEQTTGEQ